MVRPPPASPFFSLMLSADLKTVCAQARHDGGAVQVAPRDPQRVRRRVPSDRPRLRVRRAQRRAERRQAHERAARRQDGPDDRRKGASLPSSQCLFDRERALTPVLVRLSRARSCSTRPRTSATSSRRTSRRRTSAPSCRRSAPGSAGEAAAAAASRSRSRSGRIGEGELPEPFSSFFCCLLSSPLCAVRSPFLSASSPLVARSLRSIGKDGSSTGARALPPRGPCPRTRAGRPSAFASPVRLKPHCRLARKVRAVLLSPARPRPSYPLRSPRHRLPAAPLRCSALRFRLCTRSCAAQPPRARQARHAGAPRRVCAPRAPLSPRRHRSCRKTNRHAEPTRSR